VRSWSNIRVAQHLAVGRHLVAEVRSDLESSGEIPYATVFVVERHHQTTGALYEMNQKRREAPLPETSSPEVHDVLYEPEVKIGRKKYKVSEIPGLIRSLNDTIKEQEEDLEAILAEERERIQERLEAAGIRGKYIPPEDELEELIASDFEADIDFKVASAVDDLVDKDAIVTSVTEALRERLQVSEPAAFIRESFEADPYRSWSDVIDEEHRWRTREAGEEITELVRETIEQRVEE
jgi:hypothetical protein